MTLIVFREPFRSKSTSLAQLQNAYALMMDSPSPASTVFSCLHWAKALTPTFETLPRSAETSVVHP